LKITHFPFKNFRRTVYTAIKSINEPPFPRTKTLPSIATKTPRQMQAWIIYYYGTNQQFTLSNNVQIPTILSPSDVLIKISASSINPIDIRRREGYGQRLISTYQTLRNVLELGSNHPNKLDFPMILGRDFCGEIVRKGPKVSKFKVGDKVYGALNVTRQGTFAQYCVSDEDEICLKPKNISDDEAASLPLVSLTSWYAIRKFSGFNEDNAFGKRALLVGAGGGVGQIATQLCKNLNMETTALCGLSSFNYLRELGATDLIDHRQTNWLSELSNKPKFDLIFDTVGPKHYSFELMSPLLNRGGTFVTIVTPLFPNVDKYGLVSGLARSAYKAARKTIYGFSNGTNYRWAFYRADGEVLHQIQSLVEQNKLKTRLDPRRFTFEQIPDAMAYVESGQATGKVVIKYNH